jgi:hypothetical protein
MSSTQLSIPRWPAWLFVTLAALYLLPVWAVSRLPTVDGPSHLYNAWVLDHLGDRAHHPLLASTFDFDPRPVPNWLSTGALLALFRVLAPLAAEKALVSAYLVLFFASLWYLAGSVSGDRRWLAFLGFPFAYSLLFELGFYNFCFSLAFYLLALGLWWRRRASPGLVSALALNAVLLLCYFSHILSVDLALFSIAVLWLGTLRRDKWRGHLLHIPLLAPQLALPLWFMLRDGLRVEPARTTLRAMLAGLVRLDALRAFETTRGWVGFAVAAAFGLGFARSVALRWRDMRASRVGTEPGATSWWRAEDAFLLLAALLLVIYFFAPEGLAGGSNLKPRLSLYPFLALLPWLCAPFPAAARAAGIGALTLLALVNLGAVWSCWRTLDRQVASYLHTLDPVAPGSRIMPLSWDHDGGCARAGVFVHALDYVAIEKGLIDWNDYEAMTDYFPVRFKPGVRHPGNFQMEWAPDTLPLEELAGATDYIVAWHMPADSPLGARILRRYDQILARGPALLFVRRSVD